MTIFTLSPAEFNVGLISALNLSLPTNQAKLRQILAKAAAKQQLLAQLQQILAKKTSHTICTAADAAGSYAPLGLEAPPGLCLPDGIAPPLGLVPPIALACPDRSKVGERRNEGVSAIDDYIGSDADDTSIGAGSMKHSVSEGTEFEAENFPMNPDAPCVVPSFVHAAPCAQPLVNMHKHTEDWVQASYHRLSTTTTTIATLSPAEFNVGLLSALNVSLPTNQAKLRRILAKTAAKQQILAQLQQILAQKTSHTFCTAADAAGSYPLLGLAAPPGLCLPDGIAPPPGLVPATGLARPDCSRECRKNCISGIDDYIGSDAEDTVIGEGSMTRSVSDGTESEAENLQMNANSPCFVRSFVSTVPRKVPSPHKATGTPLLPVWIYADQAQQGGA